MRIGGHDFNTDPDTALKCGWCGMLYRDYLRNAGGCVTTPAGPIKMDGDGNPTHVVAADGAKLVRGRVVGPVEVEARFELQAVGEDWDGTVKPIDKLTYPEAKAAVRAEVEKHAGRCPVVTVGDLRLPDSMVREIADAAVVHVNAPDPVGDVKAMMDRVRQDAKPWPPSPGECECRTWGRENMGEPGHHPSCQHAVKPTSADVMRRLVAMMGKCATAYTRIGDAATRAASHPTLNNCRCTTVSVGRGPAVVPIYSPDAKKIGELIPDGVTHAGMVTFTGMIDERETIASGFGVIRFRDAVNGFVPETMYQPPSVAPPLKLSSEPVPVEVLGRIARIEVRESPSQFAREVATAVADLIARNFGMDKVDAEVAGRIAQAAATEVVYSNRVR